MGQPGNGEQRIGNGARPLTDKEASDWFGFRERANLYTVTGQVGAYTGPGGVGRFMGHRLDGILHQCYWDPQARIVRMSCRQDDDWVQMFRAAPWARIYQNSADNRLWVVAEGKVEISAPSLEPGDEIGQELYKTCRSPRVRSDEQEDYRRLAESRTVVLRVHVTQLYGAIRPEDEWQEPEPMYW